MGVGFATGPASSTAALRSSRLLEPLADGTPEDPDTRAVLVEQAHHRATALADHRRKPLTTSRPSGCLSAAPGPRPPPARPRRATSPRAAPGASTLCALTLDSVAARCRFSCASREPSDLLQPD